MVLGWLLLLAMALPPGARGAKECVFCELTDSTQCPGTQMHCGEDEDCFTGHGVAPGLSNIINKGCVLSTSCGREEPVTYMGVTYTLTTMCCSGHMCNSPAGTESGRREGATAAPGLVLGVLLVPHLL